MGDEPDRSAYVAEQFQMNSAIRLDEVLADDASKPPEDLRAARDWVASREQLKYIDLRLQLTAYDERTAASSIAATSFTCLGIDI
jgi:hypothetical protein